ncbi:MAG: DUF2971 domain-containing protein, partial [Chloroflexi bacterium]|nr:DUF2971 domain-containing protein [Chloroflexota bacterium]
GGLRLSQSDTMNDPDEGRATTDDRFLLKLLKDCSDSMPWVWERYRSAYICCFVGVADSTDHPIDAGDDLLFWRLYGNECRGVSISTPPHVSQQLIESSLVRPVIYTDEPPFQIDLPAISSLLRDLDELRARAIDADIWRDIASDVLSPCDRLFGERFLHKRRHYEMEREYRAIVFDAPNDTATIDVTDVVSRGIHVQFGLCRKYVQVKQLNCNKIFTTDSQITIGSNVLEPTGVKGIIADLLETIDLVPTAVSIRTSKIPYRPR